MGHKKPIILIVVAVAILAVIAAMAWYSGDRRETPVPSSSSQPPAGSAIASPDLGSTIYEDAKNPIGDKLPESAAPVPNPIEGIYKNPFE